MPFQFYPKQLGAHVLLAGCAHADDGSFVPQGGELPGEERGGFSCWWGLHKLKMTTRASDMQAVLWSGYHVPDGGTEMTK